LEAEAGPDEKIAAIDAAQACPAGVITVRKAKNL
jgi:hypothetical protein